MMRSQMVKMWTNFAKYGWEFFKNCIKIFVYENYLIF
jgi:hypothetical protein